MKKALVWIAVVAGLSANAYSQPPREPRGSAAALSEDSQRGPRRGPTLPYKGPRPECFEICDPPGSEPARPGTGPRPPKGGERPCRRVDVDEPLNAREAVCPVWRKIALKTNPDDACPPLIGWKVRHLFEASGSDPASAAYAMALPPALRPFCVYEMDRRWPTRKIDRKRLPGPVKSNGFERIDSSCAALAPAAGLVDFRQHFLNQEALMTWSPGTQSQLAADSSDRIVDLIFLDTQPTGSNTIPGNSDHGFALAKLAEDLLCGQGSPAPCRADVSHQLALPIVDFDPLDLIATVRSEQHGGFFGSIDRLALALQQAVDGSSANHLVINLSVAWNGEEFSGTEEIAKMDVPVQAMYAALGFASCRGALVVAAAGNRLGGPEAEEGPLLPAGWETRSAPDAATCQQDYWVESHGEDSGLDQGSGEPLIYAVAGVRADNVPLANARPGSEPKIVALGDHAGVEIPGTATDTYRTTVLTGSSVATTVVASAAAALWYERPDLSRAELMDHLYFSGESVERNAADYYYPNGSASVSRRVSQCAALRSVCSKDKDKDKDNEPEPCTSGGVTCLEPPGLTSKNTSTCSTILFDAATMLLDNPEAAQLCTSLNHMSGTEPPNTDPCPFLQFYGIDARHWTGPQPGDDPCSSCPARPPPDKSGTYTLEIEINDDWPRMRPYAQSGTGKIYKIYLDVDGKTYNLGSDFELKGGDCAIVENIPSEPGPMPTMTLRFMTEFGSYMSPIFVHQQALNTEE